MKKVIYPSFNEEQKLWDKGYRCVIGLDEVGRGAFAGSVVVGAVIFEKNIDRNLVSDVNDSKLLKPLKREALAKIIKDTSVCSLVASMSVSIINKYGIGKATQMAFRKIVSEVRERFKGERFFVLVDGFHVRYLRGIGLKSQKAIVKGDQKSISIAAASIVAKVYRDGLMKKLSKKYPCYKFSKNKGYGTSEHRLAIKNYGLSKIHRKSFDLQKFVR